MPNTQLCMRRDLDGGAPPLPPVVVPEGYSLRTYAGTADDAAWVHIMNNSLGNKYALDSFRNSISTRPQFRPEILYFVTHGGAAVGSACAWRHAISERRVGYVHMVGVVPEHRGKGLGRLVTLRTLHHFKEDGFDLAVLNTDDFRLAAIKSYLGLGFRPWVADSDHPDRWVALFRKLDETARTS
jgi:mycothiol synthase